MSLYLPSLNHRHLNNRLGHRKTFIEIVLIGPIKDSSGLEQDGVYSDNIYKYACAEGGADLTIAHALHLRKACKNSNS